MFIQQLRKFFNSAVFYDSVQWICAPLGSLLIMRFLKNLAANNPKRVLDVGCGTGKYSRIFKNSDYVGVDVDNAYLTQAARRYPFGRFFKGEANHLPVADGSFNLIFCISTFHHLSDEEARVSALEMTRVCADDGLVVIIDNIYPSAWNIIGNLLFSIDRGRHQRSFANLAAILQPSGFSLIGKRSAFPYEYAFFKYQK